MVPWGGNSSVDLIDQLEAELPESSVYWMLISIVAAIIWVLYICYYNSHVIGFFLTLFVNKFVKNAHVRFGENYCILLYIRSTSNYGQLIHFYNHCESTNRKNS